MVALHPLDELERAGADNAARVLTVEPGSVPQSAAGTSCRCASA